MTANLFKRGNMKFELDEKNLVCRFMGREIPIATFDFKNTEPPKKRSKLRPGVCAPFTSMSEDSRVRVFGDQYWREGTVVAECYIRREDAVFQWGGICYPKDPATVFGRFCCVVHCHGGHPFDPSKPLAQPCYNGPFTSDRYCWSAGCYPIPSDIEFAKVKSDSVAREILCRIKTEYDRHMGRTPYGNVVYRNCENHNFVGCEV